MTTILLDDSGVLKCMTYVPEKPKFIDTVEYVENCLNDKAMKEYRLECDKASVPFDRLADREHIFHSIQVQGNPVARLKPGLYQIDVEVEIVEILGPGWVPTYNDPDNSGGHPNAEPMQVARIKSPQPEESQEELWNEAISLIVDFPGSYESKDLIEKFSITRRKPLN